MSRFLWSLLLLLALVNPAAAQDASLDPQVPQSQHQLSLSFSPVAKKAASAVVNIFSSRKVRVREAASPLLNDPFFQQFFGGKALGGVPREKVVRSLGSGVIVSSTGLVVTSNHVIKDSQEITVALADKREFEAKVLLQDSKTDLAFLQIQEKVQLPFLELRNSDELEVGDLVLAIGNPFGIGQTVTQGIISALARGATGVSDYQFFIQTDAAINPGNSGGALVDMQGRLIGINTAIYSRSGGSNGIGFAIPSNMVKALADSKVEGGQIIRPWLGISGQTVTREIANSLGLALPKGVLVARVAKDSPAWRGGVREGDVVLAVGGIEVLDPQAMEYRIALGRIGEKAKLTLLRKGQQIQAEVALEAAPEIPAAATKKLMGKHPLAGLIVAELSPALAEKLKLDYDAKGLAVVGGGASLGGFSFRGGDVILQVNGRDVATIAEMEHALVSNNRQWEVVVLRSGAVLTIRIQR